ncbi:Zinc finger, C3HC4 RING-type [Dillenia turbinata]|uniref:Zinc finger, C3HC4 RING-type n=1 Tax=Dillenia turbinata TaxID=194707 RepID=A0AAN8UPC5_9MAGN
MTCTVEEEEGNDGEEYLPNYDGGVVLIDSDHSEDSFYRSEDEQDPPKRRKVTQKKKSGRPKKKHKDSGMNEGEGVEFGGNVMKKKRGKKKVEDAALMWEVWEEEHERWINENIKLDTDLADQPSEMMSETIDAPSDLIMPLLRYQKEWLAWALKQEESTIKGGILADEMGMGKTIQAIALVLAKREIFRALSVINWPEISPSSSLELPKIRSTLVICPVVAVMQWVNEISRFTLDGSTKVLVYHGSNRGRSVHQFADYDFVITTYSIVESEYRKNVLPPKEKCMWCGKAFHQRKLPIHLKYFCGPDAMKTAEQSKQHTKKQKKWHFKKKKSTGDKKKGNSHNKKKKDQKEEDGCTSVTEGSESSEEDEVLVTSSSKSAAPEQDSSAKKSILHSFMWERIILDEAHFIKDRRSNTARAVLAMESSYKWALSGTPLQNRVGELYSLASISYLLQVRFLRIIPYSYYFCKDCDCRCLDYSTSTQCSNCEHKSVRHFCWWNRYIASPIQSSANGTSGRGAMLLLKHKILKSVLLRRTKKGRAADLALPPRIVSLRRDALDVKEEDYYTSLYNESQAQFNTYVQQGTVMNNYAHIFDLLTRLRQAVDHPYLVVYSKTAVGLINSGNSEEHVCGLCSDPAEDPVVTSCAHVFCKPCLVDFSTSLGQVSCPSCSKPLTVDLTTNPEASSLKHKVTVKGFKHSSILNRIRLEDFQTSTKIDALSGISCVQLVGSMSLSARDAAISKFTDDPDCKIFLMSLKAGGVALNLTVASHVFLMDPWWNPAVERQAQDRIHRIGQYKPIRIVRFVIENTIEERILKLQEKKELVFEGTVGGSADALGKLTEADMRFLFVT